MKRKLRALFDSPALPVMRGVSGRVYGTGLADVRQGQRHGFKWLLSVMASVFACFWKMLPKNKTPRANASRGLGART